MFNVQHLELFPIGGRLHRPSMSSKHEQRKALKKAQDRQVINYKQTLFIHQQTKERERCTSTARGRSSGSKLLLCYSDFEAKHKGSWNIMSVCAVVARVGWGGVILPASCHAALPTSARPRRALCQGVSNFPLTLKPNCHQHQMPPRV